MSEPRNLQHEWERWLTLLGQFEDELCDMGAGDFDHLGHDPYDMSIEFLKCDNDMRLSEDAQRFVRNSGFQVAYLNHDDGSETIYRWAAGDSEPHPGYRSLRKKATAA